MAVLTVNAGSGSLHLAYVEDDAAGARLDLSQPPGSAQAAQAVADLLAANPEPEAVGHRLVHGGELVRRPTVLDDRLRGSTGRRDRLAPLHLPPALGAPGPVTRAVA